MIRHWLQTLLEYFKTPPVVYRTQQQQELRDELEFHLASSIQERTDAGDTTEHARQAAFDRLGDLETIARECGSISVTRHLFWHRLHLSLSLVLIGIVGYLFVQADREEPQAENASLAKTDASELARTGSINGTVVDEQGEPIRAANVLAVVKNWPANGYRQQSYTTVTRSDGTFSIENVVPSDEEYEVQIAVIADGHPLQSKYIPMTTGQLAAIQFQLQQSSKFALRFESPNGEPLAGVEAFPFERVDRQGTEHCVYFCSADPIVRRSSDSGRVPMPHFLPGEKVSVYVRFPNKDWETRELVVPRTGENVIVLTSNAIESPLNGI